MNFTPFEILDVSILSPTQQVRISINPVPGVLLKRLQEAKTAVISNSGMHHDFTELACWCRA